MRYGLLVLDRQVLEITKNEKARPLLSHWQSRKERLPIDDRPCEYNAPSSRGRAVNGLTAKAIVCDIELFGSASRSRPDYVMPGL